MSENCYEKLNKPLAKGDKGESKTILLNFVGKCCEENARGSLMNIHQNFGSLFEKL